MGGEGGGLSRSHRADEIPNFKGFPPSLPPFESIQFVFGLRLQLAGKRVIRVVRAAYKRAEEAIKVAWRVYRRDLPLFRVVADTSIPGKRARNGTKRIIKATQPLSTTTFQSPDPSFWDVAWFRYTGNYSKKRWPRDQTCFSGKTSPPDFPIATDDPFSSFASRVIDSSAIWFVERLIERGSTKDDDDDDDDESPLLALVPDRF